MRILTKLAGSDGGYVLVEMKGENNRRRLSKLITQNDLEGAMSEIFSKCEPLAYVPDEQIGRIPADLVITGESVLWKANSHRTH